MKIHSFVHIYPWPLPCYERSAFLNHTSNHVIAIKKKTAVFKTLNKDAFRNQYKGSPDPSDYCDCIIEYWSTDLKLSFSDTVGIAACLSWPLSDISEFRGRTAGSVYNLYWISILQALSKRDSTDPLSRKGWHMDPILALSLINHHAAL